MRFESSQSRRAQVPGCRGDARGVDGPAVASNSLLQRFLAGGQARISAELRERRLGLRTPVRMRPVPLVLLWLSGLCAGPLGLYMSPMIIDDFVNLAATAGPTAAPPPPEWPAPHPKLPVFDADHRYVIVYAGWQVPTAQEGLQAEVPTPQFR